MSRSDEKAKEILDKLESMRNPPKAFYMVLLDTRSELPYLMWRLVVAGVLVLLAAAVSAWSFRGGFTAAGYAVAVISLIGLFSVLHVLVMMWARGKNLRQSAAVRYDVEGPEGWLWKQEGLLMRWVGADVSDEAVRSLVKSCEESKNREFIRDAEALRDYWLWIAMLHDHALEALGRPPLGGVRIRKDTGSVGKESE